MTEASFHLSVTTALSVWTQLLKHTTLHIQLRYSTLTTRKRKQADNAASNNVHFRTMEPGHMANVLCLLGVWDKCLETVTASTDKVECYALNAEEFQAIFANIYEDALR